MNLQVTEIFHSIQGESTHAGLPCVFLRLTGCNLRCRWCDTEYAFYGGRRMSLDEVIDSVIAFNCPLVEITGGEPMLQAPAVVEVSHRMLTAGRTVLIETSGERDLSPLPVGVVKIVDVKCPASGEGGSFRESNLAVLGANDELKFVLSDRGDYDFARDFIAVHHLTGSAPALLFSPAFRQDARGQRSSSQCQLDPQALAEWMLADRVPARLAMQLHKFIWDPARRSV